ncbi:DUF6116 family protein [Pseudoxanthomonas winnipegensis]|uniref:DUF6116 family protein n=1 Tax=Pseudoxanthomonas winnipegensis TaxID=2480810 RepID=UPI0030F3F040
MPSPLVSPLLRWARRLRHPTPFKLTALLFVVDLAVPDFIPFVDEILLGLGTLLLANWKDRRAQPSLDTRPRSAR